MANKTVYPYGTGGSLPSSVGLINDLITGGVDKALTAEQGVVMKGITDDLDERKIDKMQGAETAVDLEFYSSIYIPYYINATRNAWAGSSGTRSFFVPIKPKYTYRVTANATNQSRIAILTNMEHSGSPSYATGESMLHFINAGQTYTFTAPEDAHYLNCNYSLSNLSTVIMPSAIVEISDLFSDAIEQVGLNTEHIAKLEGEWKDEWDYETAPVLSNNTSAITVTKEDGKIIVDNIASTGSAYGLIGLPYLIGGKTYKVTIDYKSNFQKLTSWWLGFVDSSYNLTSGGFDLKLGENVTTMQYTHQTANVYLRLASKSADTGAQVIFNSISFISSETTVADLSERVSALEQGGSDNEMENIIRQAKKVASGNPLLGLLHFSDIHGDTVAATQIKAFYQKYANYIDDMVQTGDAVYYYWNSANQGYEWYQQHGIPEALFVIGNHDGAENSNANGWLEGSADWDFKGKEWDFDTYFADYISTRGVVPPTGYDDPSSDYYKALYWHKDYADAKVRVIGLDCLHFNDTVRYLKSDQETWLATRLAETLNSSNAAYGYSVIVLNHYPIDDLSGDNETWNDSTHKFVYNQNANGGVVMDCNTGQEVTFHVGGNVMTMEKKFCMRDRTGEVGSTNYSKGDNNPLAEIIQTWVNNGGKFIAWLSGHTHIDYMYYSRKYPDLLCIGLPQAGNTRGTAVADRAEDSPMHPCANLYVVDTNSHLIKIIRFGLTLTRTLMKIETLCYNYESKTISIR